MNNLFTTVYEDDEVLCVNKQAGILSVPDRFNSSNPDLYTYLNKKQKVFVVHRLDRGTSGILCFAKNRKSHKKLCELFEQRKIKKKYLTLVRGIPSQSDSKVEMGIKAHPTRPNEMVISSNGKPSLTHYNTIDTYGNITFMEIIPVTGRTHQIRIHLSYIGHPLLVDPVYGNSNVFYLSEIKRNYMVGKGKVEQPLLSRVALHAYSLSFPPLFGNKTLTCVAPLAKDMKAVLTQLSKIYGKRIIY